MKALTIISGFSIVIFSAIANATILPQAGTFTASQCGAEVIETDLDAALTIQEVCFGSVDTFDYPAGRPAVSFRLTDGSERIFRIADVAPIRAVSTMGKSETTLFLVDHNSEEAVMTITYGSTGKIESVVGRLGEIDYEVSDFNSIVVIF